MRRMLLVGAVLCAATSCTQVTQTTVVIDADSEIQDATPRRVEVTVIRQDGSTALLEPADTARFPLTVALVPTGGDASRTYEVRARVTSGGRFWETRAISGFIQGQRRELRLRLVDVCQDRECPDMQVCRTGECEALTPQETTPVGAGDDSGTVRPDAAVPTGTDAPVPLADAGPMEGCGWQPTETIATGDFPVAPLISVDGDNVFVAYTVDTGVMSMQDVRMVRGPVGRREWSAPVSLLDAQAVGVRAISFRVDEGTWRLATRTGSTNRLLTDGRAGFEALPTTAKPQMGWSATSGPRFLFNDTTGASAIWTPSGPRTIVSGTPPGVPAYAPNNADDSVVANGMLYRHRNGVELVVPVSVDSGLSCTLLSEPDGTLHVIYGAPGATLHRVVPPEAAVPSDPTTLVAPNPSSQTAAAGDGVFYWGGALWHSDGRMEPVTLPIGGEIATGGLVIDENGGMHLVGRVGTGVQYAYRHPCP